MNQTDITLYAQQPLARTPSVADFVALGFRWRNRMMITFFLVILFTLPFAIGFKEYESEMKFLARRERAVPFVGVEQNLGPVSQDLSEKDLNAEVELIRSLDVLRGVVLALKMQETTSPPLWYRLTGASAGDDTEVRIAKAIRNLTNKLEVTLPKESDIITVRYTAGEPAKAAAVLQELSKLYLEKHTAVRRREGQFQFFAEQTEHYRKKLEEAENRLARFPREGGSVAGALEVDLAVQRIARLRESLQQSETAIGETRKRVQILEEQLAATPSRLTTAVRTSQNANLMMQLEGELLTLELKRTDLLQRYQSDYPQVRAVEEQIAKARASIQAAKASPMLDETTDRNPTYEWLRSELAKAQTELNSLTVRANSLQKTLQENEEMARRLNSKSIEQQDLLRTARSLEDNYKLYQKKREEARIEDELDRDRFLNVTIAQAPVVPVLPKRSPMILSLFGLFAAVALSGGIALVSEYMDRSFRNRWEVEQVLQVPVLALLPAKEVKRLAGPAQEAGE